MIAAVLLLAIAVPSIFLSLYRASHLSGWKEFVWTFVGLLSLAVTCACILYLAVPGFFAEFGL